MATVAPTFPANVVPITREGDRILRERLAALTTAGRAEASARIRDARADGGNPAENPELIHALQAQEQLERRIAELESQLARAEVIEGSTANGEVAVGTRVRIQGPGTARRPLEYQIASSIEADPGRGRLSIESPVGAALLGRRAGDTVEVEAPGGVVRFELTAVENASVAHGREESANESTLAVGSMAA